MSLDKLLDYALSQGVSRVSSDLMPAGFTCVPVASRQERMDQVLELAVSQVKGFERTVKGKTEFVRPHESAEHGWMHPDAVGGHKVLGVYSHPKSPHVLLDLGHGLHAEGRPGAKPGAVMKSNTGLNKAELQGMGWKYERTPKPLVAPQPPASGKAGTRTSTGSARTAASKPATAVSAQGNRRGAAGKSALAKVTGANRPLSQMRPSRGAAAQAVKQGLAEQQRDYMSRAGYKIDPNDWEQDWVPSHEDRITPDLHPSGDIKDVRRGGRVSGAGTAADPIDVRGNVEQALRLLSQGKHVRLNRPSELTLLMQAVNQHAAETNAGKPNAAPDWDFGRLSVKGTNLFASQNKGIARIHMPQFSGMAQPGTHAAQVAGGPGKFADLTDEFEQHLKDKGIKVERTTMPASHLRATQSELVGAKVAGFASAFLHGNPKAVKAMSEPIMVTKDGYVVDGHHRWGANMLVDAVDGRLGNDTPMNVRKVDMEIGAMIPYANHWAQQVGIAPAAAVAGDTGAALKK